MLNDKRVLAFIPARAGSKGLPGKNYKRMLKKPLVDWSIEAASRSCHVDTIAVSTNCEQVKKIASVRNENTNWVLCDKNGKNESLAFKLYIVDRPDALSTANSSTEEAMKHCINHMYERFSLEYDIIVLLQPTSPARPDNLVDKCLQKMDEDGCDSVMTVSSHTPFFWRMEDGCAVPNYDPNNRPMRQELAERDIMYHDNGNLYAVYVDKLLNKGRVGDKPRLVETSIYESFQIDNEEDFAILESLAKCYKDLL